MSPFPAEVRWTLALNNALVAPPAYDGSDGYFPIQGDRVVAYDLRRGAQQWMVTGRPLSAPAVGGGFVFLEQTGNLTALNAKDGAVAWTVPLAERLIVPLVWGHGRLVATTATAILSYLAADGTLQWRHDVEAKPSQRPSLAEDHVFVPMADGRVLALGGGDGERVWERKLPEAPNEILVMDSELFVGSNDNYLYCLNASDGLTRWRSPRTGSDVVSRPTIDGDRIYFISLDNVLRSLNRGNGVQQWKKGLPFRPAWTPIVGADTVMVTSLQGPLRAFYKKDGAAGGEQPTGADLIAAPPYAFQSPEAIGPVLVLVTRNAKTGATVRAVSRRIEPPIVPLGVLPGLVPAPGSSPPKPGEAPLDREERRREVPTILAPTPR